MLRLSQAIGSGGAAARRDAPSRRGDALAFFAVCAALFAAGVTATILCHRSMPNAQPMRDGGMLPSAWAAMCGTASPGSAAAFLGMWSAMTLAMMLPSFAPALWRWRASLVAGGAKRLAGAVAMVGAGYFAVWIAVGVGAFAASLASGAALLREPAIARAFPLAGGAVVALAGALQFSAWKARHLDACRGWAACGHGGARPAAAWRHGVRLGRHCARSCVGWTAALFVVGFMDPGAMALASVAIAAERLAVDGRSAAQVSGAIAVGFGLARLASAAVLAWR